jgi:hypothetical protein
VRFAKDMTMLVVGWALIFAVGYGIAATIDGSRTAGGCTTDDDCAQQCGGEVSDEQPDEFDIRTWEA